MKGTLYVLEDDSSIAGLVKFSLEREELVCRTFGSVREFTDGIRGKAPDVALLDVMLPDGNGLDVLRTVKERYPSVCCIMLSALGQEGDKVTGLNAGADRNDGRKPEGAAALSGFCCASRRGRKAVRRDG